LKESIRKEILNKRLSHRQIEEQSVKIAEKFCSLPEVKKAKNILLYYPHKNEVDTRPLIKKLLKKTGISVFLPKVSGKDILPVQIKDLSSLKSGYAGIKEPEGLPVKPEKLDIVVVPAIAFDKRGHRLGYGKGYYDRFLSKTNALKVGFAFDFQVVDELPAEEHDIPVDLIITPTRVIKTKEEERK